jgi:methionine-rich copper-binding protein CopC
MRIPFALAAGLLALVAVMTVSGHSEPVRFDPAPGQVLDAAPQRVDGWFSQEMRRSSDETSLEVHPVMEDGMLGDPVSGDTVIDDADRHHMSAELTGDLMPGQYVVSWSALSDEDEHADSGCYRFFVGQEAADAAIQAGARLDAAEECAGMGGDGMDDGTPSESGPSVTLTVPDKIEGREVTIGLKAEGVEIRLPTNEGQDPAFGHYHLYIDIPPNVTHKHNGDGGEPANPNDVMTTAGSHTFKDLEPGNHVVTAVLFYDDHTPFSPAVVSGASFTVPGAEESDDGIDTGAAIGLAIGIGAAGLIVGGILGLALRRRAR